MTATATANPVLLLPSMMCADFGHLADDTAALVAAGADGLHLDLMDGTYVPNYGMGLQDIEWLCANAGVPCDVHMMAMDPGGSHACRHPRARRQGGHRDQPRHELCRRRAHPSAR